MADRPKPVRPVRPPGQVARAPRPRFAPIRPNPARPAGGNQPPMEQGNNTGMAQPMQPPSRGPPPRAGPPPKAGGRNMPDAGASDQYQQQY